MIRLSLFFALIASPVLAAGQTEINDTFCNDMQVAIMNNTVPATTMVHKTWDAFLESGPGRLLLLSTKGTVFPTRFRFADDDRLILGRESSGVPEAVAAQADEVIRIPMASAARSLNVVTAGAIALAEALRQTDGWPAD